MKESRYTLDKVSKLIGIKKEILEEGSIQLVDGHISEEDFEILKNQKEKYVSLRDFLRERNTYNFDSKYSSNREKYRSFLEINDFFGCEHRKSREMLIAGKSEVDWYILKIDIPIIQEKSAVFFQEYGLTEYEKLTRLIYKYSDNSKGIKYLREFEKKKKNKEEDKNLYTPAFREFAEKILTIDDISLLSANDILIIKESMKYEKSKDFFIEFLRHVSKKEKVPFSEIKQQRKEYNEVSAYSADQYIWLSEMLFSEEYCRKHKLIEKALNDHLNGETWLFLSIYYICGWRSESICNNWIYLNLKKNNIWRINTETLKEDILYDRIKKEVYIEVGKYLERKVLLMRKYPEKTLRYNPSQLLVAIQCEEYRIHFGRLMLIAEANRLSHQEGHLKNNRRHIYRSWKKISDFFGEEYIEHFGRRNINTTRLNKSYLQGIVIAGVEMGYSPMTGVFMGLYARNHNNPTTTLMYLRDCGLTKETAEVVVYCAFQMGVDSYCIYNILLEAYPEDFGSLSKREQSFVIEQLGISSYELEILGKSYEASIRLIDKIVSGNPKAVERMLRAMFEMSNDRGHGKEFGVYCIKRALGENCDHASFESCIANACPNHIFTYAAVPELAEVIKRYLEKYKETGNQKFLAVIDQIIKPTFSEALNKIFEDNNDEDAKQKIVSYLEDKIYGKR